MIAPRRRWTRQDFIAIILAIVTLAVLAYYFWGLDNHQPNL